MPCSMRARILSASSTAGPSVQIIFVFLIEISLTQTPRIRTRREKRRQDLLGRLLCRSHLACLAVPSEPCTYALLVPASSRRTRTPFRSIPDRARPSSSSPRYAARMTRTPLSSRETRSRSRKAHFTFLDVFPAHCFCRADPASIRQRAPCTKTIAHAAICAGIGLERARIPGVEYVCSVAAGAAYHRKGLRTKATATTAGTLLGQRVHI